MPKAVRQLTFLLQAVQNMIFPSVEDTGTSPTQSVSLVEVESFVSSIIRQLYQAVNNACISLLQTTVKLQMSRVPAESVQHNLSQAARMAKKNQGNILLSICTRRNYSVFISGSKKALYVEKKCPKYSHYDGSYSICPD